MGRPAISLSHAVVLSSNDGIKLVLIFEVQIDNKICIHNFSLGHLETLGDTSERQCLLPV